MSYLLFQLYSSLLIASRWYTQPQHWVNVRTNAFCYAKRYCFTDAERR